VTAAAAHRPAPPARWQADLALVVAAFFFGTTFLVVQDAVEAAEPLPFLAARFLIAGAALAVLGRGRSGTAGEWRHGVLAGLTLMLGYVVQTVGLQYTSASTSAFITYLLVVFVPLLSFVGLRRRPHPLTLVGLALAIAGLVLLTGGAQASFGRGEVLTLGCALAFAAHIVILGETAGRHDPIRFTCIQVTTVGAACLVLSVPTAGLALGAGAWGAAAFTGIFATALAFFAMVWAQRVVSPSRAALILLLEPVFAALLSWVTGDPLTASMVAGGALILVAVAVAEIVPPWLGARREREERGGRREAA
jgi:drug/metabolite transporter (DMT)-like permease